MDWAAESHGGRGSKKAMAQRNKKEKQETTFVGPMHEMVHPTS
jgi:hypothetical protein